MNRTHERLRVLTCDARDEASVCQALKGQDVVFCTLGEKSRGAMTLYSEGALNTLRGMQANNVRRLVFLSNFGILGERAQDLGGALLLFLVKRVIRHTLDDHRRALELIRTHAPEWIVVRPMALTNGPCAGRYRIAVDGVPARGRKVARADVAHFMLLQATGNEYLNQVPAIAY
jgi:putative NADH-flavin reductase